MSIIQELINQLSNIQLIRKAKVEQRNKLYSTKNELIELLKHVNKEINNVTEEIEETYLQSNIITDQLDIVIEHENCK